MARPLPINPTFLPPTHGVLKSLLENPLKLPFHHDEGFGKDKDKEKKLDDESGVVSHPQSAFLGPTLWDKTLPYDGDNFQLEYMDLEEFLSENGIPANTAQSEQATQAAQPPQTPLQQAPAPPTPSVVDLSSRATTSVHTGMAPQTCLRSPSTAAPPPPPYPTRTTTTPLCLQAVQQDDRYWARRRKNNVAAKRSRDARRLKENQIAIRAGFLEKENAALRMEVADLRKELGRCKNIVAKYEARHGPLAASDGRLRSDKREGTQRRSEHTAPLPSSRDTPSPIDPESIQVPVTYDPDPADLALSSVPGQEMFDPRKRKFSAEELKPQPMIKKARKVFIPEDLKDDRYWARRRKNNVAAKRSRDARRLKENQIAIRAGFLEKENAALRMEVADLRKELGRCKNIVAKYEARHGPL
ncbi:hypothetical protein PAMA_009913 [Pampus argenteus]